MCYPKRKLLVIFSSVVINLIIRIYRGIYKKECTKMYRRCRPLGAIGARVPIGECVQVITSINNVDLIYWNFCHFAFNMQHSCYNRHRHTNMWTSSNYFITIFMVTHTFSFRIEKWKYFCISNQFNIGNKSSDYINNDKR